MEKELKAQNRLKALELASIVYPNKVVRAEELVNTLKKRAEELLDWAYEEEEKEVKPDECECFSCQDLIDRIEKAYIEMQEKELEKEFRELIKKYTDLIK